MFFYINLVHKLYCSFPVRVAPHLCAITEMLKEEVNNRKYEEMQYLRRPMLYTELQHFCSLSSLYILYGFSQFNRLSLHLKTFAHLSIKTQKTYKT